MKEKDQWITDVLESMNDSERAVPKADLFAKIEAQIEKLPEVEQLSPIRRTPSKIISIRRWQLAAAIALLLIINVFTLYQSVPSNTSSATAENINGGKHQLLSNYKIYE